MHGKKLLIFKNGQNGVFSGNAFFWCIFKNSEQNNNCVFIVFETESEPKHEEKIFVCVFLLKPKTCFFGGKNKIVKGSFIPIFPKKY